MIDRLTDFEGKGKRGDLKRGRLFAPLRKGGTCCTTTPPKRAAGLCAHSSAEHRVSRLRSPYLGLVCDRARHVAQAACIN